MEEKTMENQPDLEQVPVAVEDKKVKPLTIVILLIAILLIGAGAVYAGMQLGKKQTLSSIPTQVAQPTLSVVIPTTSASTETANWKTYTNTRYGYKFEYPSSWYFLKMSEVGYGGNDQLSSFNSEEATPENARITSFWKDKLLVEFQKMIKNKDNGQTLEEWYQSFNQESSPNERTITKTTIDGQNALLTKTNPAVPMNESYFIEKSDGIYFITASGDLSSNRKIFDQILSTFKFLK